MNSYKNDGDIDLKIIFKALIEKKLFISLVLSLSVLFSILYSLSIPNAYSSSALLAPSNSDDSLPSSLSAFSTIAGFAGVNLPGDSNNSSQEAIERIQSYDFFATFFLPEIKIENLLAVAGWNPDTNMIIYDDSIYDNKSNKWITKPGNKKKSTPSNQKAYKEYKNSLQIIENSKSSFVTITVEHQSPYIAKQWLEIIIDKINESMRLEDKEETSNSIKFLKETLTSNNNKNIEEVITQLLESQMQNLMLVSVSDSYIYKIIDSPRVAEEKMSPNRILIVIIGSFLGLMLSILLALIIYFRKIV